MASPQIIIKAKPNTEGALCAWMDAVATKYPSYTSMFIKLALKHFITTGEYLTLGSVPPVTDDYPFKRKEYVVSIFVDEDIDNWRADVKSKKIVLKLAILNILTRSITIDEKLEKPVVASYGDLVEIPSMKTKGQAITNTYVRRYSDIAETIPPRQIYRQATPEVKSEIKAEPLQTINPEKEKSSAANKTIASKTGRVFW